VAGDAEPDPRTGALPNVHSVDVGTVFEELPNGQHWKASRTSRGTEWTRIIPRSLNYARIQATLVIAIVTVLASGIFAFLQIF
jgi:hypothetical protein